VVDKDNDFKYIAKEKVAQGNQVNPIK